MKYIKSEENVCDYSSLNPYKDLLKFKEIIHYVYFVADDATAKALTIDIIKKLTKNDTSSPKISKIEQLLQT